MGVVTLEQMFAVFEKYVREFGVSNYSVADDVSLLDGKVSQTMKIIRMSGVSGFENVKSLKFYGGWLRPISYDIVPASISFTYTRRDNHATVEQISDAERVLLEFLIAGNEGRITADGISQSFPDIPPETLTDDAIYHIFNRSLKKAGINTPIVDISRPGGVSDTVRAFDEDDEVHDMTVVAFDESDERFLHVKSISFHGYRKSTDSSPAVFPVIRVSYTNHTSTTTLLDNAADKQAEVLFLYLLDAGKHHRISAKGPFERTAEPSDESPQIKYEELVELVRNVSECLEALKARIGYSLKK